MRVMETRQNGRASMSAPAVHRGSHGGSFSASRKLSTASALRDGEGEMGTAHGEAAQRVAAETVVERILKAGDPNSMSTPVYFDYRKEARTYKPFTTTMQCAMHFSLDGCIIPKDSPEAAEQREDQERRIAEVEKAAAAELNPDLAEEFGPTRILKNQFNYSDRGSQTMNNALKERVVATDPPPSMTFGGLATAWAIYDAYEAERIQSEKEAAAQRRAAQANRATKEDEEAAASTAANALVRDEASLMPKNAEELLHSSTFSQALRVMERMVNQNDCNDIIDDFKYWEDQSDAYKTEGTLLPLWQFFSERTRKKTVTAIALNQRYSDMFAVGYGTYDFQDSVRGAVHCYTLKNAVPSASGGAPIAAHPEFAFQLDSGVLCLAFHPKEPSLLACGLHDGSVCVYDLRVCSPNGESSPARQQSTIRPLYRSTVRNGKHLDPVWQIFWKEATVEPSFYSISTDGRITSWALSKKELVSRDVIKLSTGNCTSDPEQTILNELGGMSLDYSTVHDKAAVGTQEGELMLCTMSHNGQVLERYEGHKMAIYATKWSPYDPDIFLTCSADWTVKLWMKGSPQPLMAFDLGDAVGDVAWSPYSSTVFAAVTAGGKVCVFDVAQNKTEPLCAQTVVKNAKLTRLAFSSSNPIVYVGDTRGTVLTLKLSPNLRLTAKPGKEDATDPESLHQLEAKKLSHLVEVTLKDRKLLGA